MISHFLIKNNYILPAGRSQWGTFFSISLHSTLVCICFRCTAQWLDNHVLYKVFPLMFPVPTQHHTVITILLTLHFTSQWLFCDCQFVLLNPFTFFIFHGKFYDLLLGRKEGREPFLSLRFFKCFPFNIISAKAAYCGVACSESLQGKGRARSMANKTWCRTR